MAARNNEAIHLNVGIDYESCTSRNNTRVTDPWIKTIRGDMRIIFNGHMHNIILFAWQKLSVIVIC